MEGAMKQPAVYIMASGRNGTLYTGVTAWLTASDRKVDTGFRTNPMRKQKARAALPSLIKSPPL
jgi:hypothetical protein